MAGLCEGDNEPPGSLKVIYSLMAADGDCHHLCKLMAPVRHRWRHDKRHRWNEHRGAIGLLTGEIRNTLIVINRDAEIIAMYNYD
ncbi:hypothetical protein ANN_13614 [Periplaneta americana]|uniref:Uncharacterized protein n=1 Tax=Periplaneta americana TaxID=6978 RepID=A0ABQ8TM35_PERAM|nr:hypothetical protein ANN_13614 [Periplaneta americana]